MFHPRKRTPATLYVFASARENLRFYAQSPYREIRAAWSESIEISGLPKQLLCSAAFELCHLRNPPLKLLFRVEFRREIRAHKIQGYLLSDYLSTEAENVGIIVFNALVCGVDIMRQGSANSWQLVRSHRSSDTGSAYEHSSIVFSGPDRIADSTRNIGEVDRIRGVSADVLHFIPPIAKSLNDDPF
jgi:hypothetical protein